MFMLYALVIGIVIGRLLGGRVGRLMELRFEWAWLALAALAVQVVLFSAPVTAVVGDLGPACYVASTMVVLGVVLRNVPRIPGLFIVALGAACNLAAIIANGGYMPVTSDALGTAARITTAGYSNSVVAAHPILEALVDRFALPRWLPFANVFSIGDILISLGIVVVLVVAMRRRPSPSVHAATNPAGSDLPVVHPANSLRDVPSP